MIVANLATYPARREGLGAVLAALAPQVDRLNLVLNQYDAPLDEFAGIANLNQIVPAEDTKDAGKFYPDTAGAEWLFYVDDDLIYPADFVARTLEAMRALPPGRWLGGYHGSIYCRPRFTLRPRLFLRWLRYSPRRIAENRKFLSFYLGLETATFVDQIATNAAVIRAADAPPYAYMRDSQKFVDVRLARWCFEHDIAPVCLPRAAGWIGERPYPETIYRGFTKTNPHHVSDEIWTYAMKRPASGLRVDSRQPA